MSLDFKDLLAKHQIDPQTVLILRHTPEQPRLRRVLPWLAEKSWPEKNISRKGAKIAKKKIHGREYEAAPTYRIGSIGEIPPSDLRPYVTYRELFDRRSSWLDILIPAMPAKDIISRR